MRSKIIKTILFLFIVVFINYCTIFKINALSGTISVKSSKTTVAPSGTFTITVTVSGQKPIGVWEYALSYDSSLLQLTSTTFTPTLIDYGNGTKTSASYTYTFKALKVGKATVSVKNYSILDYSSEEKLSVSTSTATISINEVTPVVLSSNASLKSLSISNQTINPGFNKDTYEYNLELNNDIKEVTINATPEDSKAKISGIGTQKLTEGINTFSIVVSAENGATKTYKIIINVFEKDPININVGDKNYTVVKYSGIIEVPKNYQETKINLDGQEVVAYLSDITNLLLVGLKDNDGIINLFVYDSNNNTFTLYKEYSLGKAIIYPVAPKEDIPVGYEKTIIIVQEKELEVYRKKDDLNSDFYLVYGINVETGSKGFYSYDKIEETFQRFKNNTITNNIVKNDNLKIIIIISSLLFISIIVNVIFLIKNKKTIKNQ